MRQKFDVLSFFVGAAALSVMLFMYFPMFVVMIYSFNPETVNSFPMRGFSLRWYEVLFADDTLLRSVKISLAIAAISTALALVIGVTGALALFKYNFRMKQFLERVILLPITLPGILTGVAMLSFFPLIGIYVSLTAVVIGHTTFLICIVMTQIYARLKRVDPFLDEAAADLGATPMRAFFSVLLPNIKTALIGASLLAVTLSMDEIPVTFFLIARENTLPIEVYTMLRRGITPEVNAISTVIFILSLIALTLSIKFGEKESPIPTN